ncbi:PIG-L deacetylase family protein [uncultured Prochlorococcus sp.]|uniref:PIG-L deacetylase family protein n=1 Tax=uncultured Prochlorococcus sp. TaxID=159733 RepID=UPI00258F0E4E|nr:PIG-L deacetylase family protein [uncultured Prochlorococcus sp.]
MIDIKKVVLIAPHPDDETIALGGTISKFIKKGIEVSILIVSGHLPPLYKESDFENTKKEAADAFKILGVKDYEFCKIPATFIHQKPISEINQIINKFIKTRSPELVFIPFPDRHIDHRTIFDASMVACRPVGDFFPKVVLTYETLSETHWNAPAIEAQFVPDFFFDITQDIDDKLSALSAYKSQTKNNDSRSLEACKALARFRGSQNGCLYAEACKLIRAIE